MWTHSSEKSFVCERAFSEYGSLVTHMRTHSGERLYFCETCGRAFSKSGHLETHMWTRSGEKSFVCETCSLVTHMQTHSGGTTVRP